jgi:hypothetical protein
MERVVVAHAASAVVAWAVLRRYVDVKLISA